MAQSFRHTWGKENVILELKPQPYRNLKYKQSSPMQLALITETAWQKSKLL